MDGAGPSNPPDKKPDIRPIMPDLPKPPSGFRDNNDNYKKQQFKDRWNDRPETEYWPKYKEISGELLMLDCDSNRAEVLRQWLTRVKLLVTTTPGLWNSVLKAFQYARYQTGGIVRDYLNSLDANQIHELINRKHLGTDDNSLITNGGEAIDNLGNVLWQHQGTEDLLGSSIKSPDRWQH